MVVVTPPQVQPNCGVILIFNVSGSDSPGQHGLFTPLDELLLLLEELDDEQHAQFANVTTSPGFGISSPLPNRRSQTTSRLHS